MKTWLSSIVSAMVITVGLTEFARAEQPPWQQPGYDRLHETPQQRDARMDWWRAAKFGLFIHWGVYAVPAGSFRGKPVDGIGEWIMRQAEIPVTEYKAFAKQFNPVRFDPDAWAVLARSRGHEVHRDHLEAPRRFCLVPLGRDGLGCRRRDSIRQGPDRPAGSGGARTRTPLRSVLLTGPGLEPSRRCQSGSGGRAGLGRVASRRLRRVSENHRQPQVKEILTRYQPDILWWDTPMWMTRERADPLQPLLRLQPAIIANNRLGGGYAGDTDTPEQEIPATGIPGRDWEVCMTMNNTWGYKSDDHDWKSVKDLIHMLVDIVSKGGNFLLNVGPKADGTIPQESIDRLQAVGKWMQVNSGAIHDTSASPFAQLAWGRCTKRLHDGGATLYLHVFDWPADGRLLVPGLRNPVASASLLASSAVLATEVVDDGVLIQLPDKAPDELDSVIQMEVRGDLDIVKALPKQQADGSLNLTAEQAEIRNVANSQVQVETRHGMPNIGFWMEPKVKIAWRCRISQPGRFDVFADLAGPAADVTFHVQLDDDQTLVAQPQPTGDYGTFVRQRLGQLSVGRAGEDELTITPDPQHWQPINLPRCGSSRHATLRRSSSGTCECNGGAKPALGCSCTGGSMRSLRANGKARSGTAAVWSGCRTSRISRRMSTPSGSCHSSGRNLTSRPNGLSWPEPPAASTSSLPTSTTRVSRCTTPRQPHLMPKT